jgi:hypothetical protein
MNLTGRLPGPKPEPRKKAERKPIARKTPPTKRKRTASLEIARGIRQSKDRAHWRCRITGKTYQVGDPFLHGANLLEGRRNNPSPRWDAAEVDFILPMDQEQHRRFDLHKTPEDRARFLRDAAGAALRDGRTRDALELYIYADLIDWLTNLEIEERPEFAE